MKVLIKALSIIAVAVGAMVLASGASASSLGDLVWDDVDADGIQEPGELGVYGVAVNLLSGDTNNLLSSTTTEMDGSYLFLDLDAGNYIVEFLLPSSSWSFSPKDMSYDDVTDSDADTITGLSDVVVLAAGEIDRSWDAGIYQNAVPEPTTILLLGSGLIGLGRLRRRFRRS